MKRLFAMLTACMTVTCAMASCGDEKEESSVSDSSVAENASVDVDNSVVPGKWECTKLVVDGENLTELAGLPIYSVFQYDLLDDGTVELPDSLMEIADSENPVTYTWEQSGDNEIEIIGSNGSSISFVLQEGQLVNIEGTEEIYLDKVAEFTYFDFKSYYDQIMAEQAEQDEQQYVLTPVETDANGEVVSTGEPITVE